MAKKVLNMTKSSVSAGKIPRSTIGLLKENERYVNIITEIGLSVSILFLIVHLIVFFASDDVRNLPAKNLASFCTALLLEYGSTLLSTVLEGEACYVNEIAAYYFVMASAFWMLIMSYDVWQTVRRSYRETDRPSSNSNASGTNKIIIRKFLFYSTCAWLTPALLTFVVFSVLPERLYRLEFDSVRCAFRETDVMYVLVETIFGTILFLNTSFFISSVRKIYATQSAVKRLKRPAVNKNNNNNNKNNNNNSISRGKDDFAVHFKLYGRLSLIMGVTWAVEFVIYYSNFDILSTTFRIINTFEGLLIAMAFTCRTEIFDRIKSIRISSKSSSDNNEDSWQLLSFYRYVSLRR